MDTDGSGSGLTSSGFALSWTVSARARPTNASIREDDMSVYEYVCKECKKTFEVVESIVEHGSVRVKCPKCKSRRVERYWSGVNVVTSKKS